MLTNILIDEKDCSTARMQTAVTFCELTVFDVLFEVPFSLGAFHNVIMFPIIIIYYSKDSQNKNDASINSKVNFKD